ncbi:MAG: CDP-diacylglycerol--glycerol-3-phosphate 3-phosphatidyltransferase [Calditrichaeota bacterium]|nr:CDP-diacylglycerol--glycerol-3-phosphate 3-phosphatidyltransferase [Calditrichota bacterium]
MRFTVPNQLTLLRMFLTPCFLILFTKKTPSHQLAASVVFLIASLTDWYDGWYARKYHVTTRWGQFMDPLADKILVSSALIVFAFHDIIPDWMVWTFVIRDFLVTTIRLYALYMGTPIVTHILAKWKTAFQMATIFLILIFINVRNYLIPNPSTYLTGFEMVIGVAMWTVTLLTISSGLIYLYENRELVGNLLRQLSHLLLFDKRKL